MNNQSYEITVDTRKSISHSNIEFSQNNLNISELIFNITEDGTNFTLNDTDKIIVYFEKPDKTVVFQDKEVELLDKEKGKIKVLLTSQTLVKAGDVKGQISIERIEDGTRKRVNTYDFSFKVRSSIASNDSIESTNEFPMFDKALEVGEKFKDVDINGIIAAGELAKGALPKTGGTMTGNIDMDISVGSKSKGYRWRDAAGALYGIESATDGSLILYDYKNLARVWQYDPVAKRFTVLSDTNLLKKTGDTMTGNLKFDRTTGQYRWVQWTTDGVIDYSLGVINTGKYILQDTKGNQTIFEYDPTTKKFNVNVDSNLVTKNKDGQVDLVVTADGEAFDSGTANVARRRGNTVTLRIALRRKVGSADTTVATIPADMRPSTFMVTNAIASDGTVSRLTVEANGNIRLATAGKDVYATITYVVD
ncbi:MULTISPECIES: BppU family phage baseplate upper protein [Bacillus cereus group]|uniref:BppU family phage baseplate upper protein n=1 Tax=Bacillus cereus group TaxID=86661 RepID=UPI000845CBC0|nr:MULTISPECIES: BppU family phage baseplate upper protein [Bacillus cereus group]MCC2442034.1 phage baseplate upper protein [Bacillus paranthracis]MDA2593139.1 BppU family phage baseplate upper protein [Bacillus cereus group sp. Bc065]